jgi:hypothetical protein
MRMRWSVAVIFALAATAASAQRYGAAGTAARYSLLGAETVPTGQDVVSAEVGWPSVSFGLTHGYTPRSDIGIKFDLLYGYEFTTTSQFGIGVRVPLRYQAYRRDRIGVLLHVDPGIKLYTTDPSSQFGIQFPVGATIGYTATPEVNVAFGVELPMFLDFTGPGSVQMILGPLFGPAIEYHVDRQLSVGLNTRFGPIFTTRGGGSEFGMIMQLLLAYRL